MLCLYNGNCSPQSGAYFISDGKPINNFEFFRPLVIIIIILLYQLPLYAPSLEDCDNYRLIFIN